MADIFSKQMRSEVMTRIRCSGNKSTELRMIEVFRLNGITGWRRGQTLHIKPRAMVSGLRMKTRTCRSQNKKTKNARPAQTIICVKPDFVFKTLQIAVFVDGCFWHGCPKHATWPATAAAWWRLKIEGNQKRDRKVNRVLRQAGWRVLRIWEHELTKSRQAQLTRHLQRTFPVLASRSNRTKRYTEKVINEATRGYNTQ